MASEQFSIFRFSSGIVNPENVHHRSIYWNNIIRTLLLLCKIKTDNKNKTSLDLVDSIIIQYRYIFSKIRIRMAGAPRNPNDFTCHSVG